MLGQLQLDFTHVYNSIHHFMWDIDPTDFDYLMQFEE
jgi:hypothetical protein